MRFSRAGRVAMFAGIVACGGDGSTAAIPVASARFAAEPANIVAGAEFTVSVELLGADGARASGARDQVTLTVSDGSSLTGPSSIRASNGVATFTGISLTRVASNIYLRATAGSQSATTDIFNVAPGAPSGAHTLVASSISIVPTETTAVVFSFADAYGNSIPGATVAVSAAQGAVFTPNAGTTSANGSFASKFISPVGGSVAVSATVNGTAIALAAPLSVCVLPGLTVPGLVTGSLGANSCVVSGRPTALYKFTTAAAGAATFALTSVFTPRFDVKTDPPLANAFDTPSPGIPSEWLLPAGTYQLRLSAVSGSGSFSLSTTFGPGNTGCIRRFLAAPAAYSGQSLAAGDCDYGDGTFVDKYVVYSPNPCSFRVHSTTFTNFIFMMELGTGHFLQGRGGDPIGVDALMGMPSCSYLGGPFEIWVLPDEGELGGAYTLTYALFPLPSERAGAAAVPLSHERVPVDPRVLRRLRAMAGSARH